MSVPSKFNVFLSIAVFALLQGCATTYSAQSIEARVIDAETREPLAGVNVVAHWVLSFGVEGGLQTDMKLMETVTDKEGKFYFPAWGPEPIPAGLPWEARMKNQDPEIILFKSGYMWRALSNEILGPYPDAGPSVRTSEWHGKTIELKRFEGNLERYGSMISGVITGVSYGRCRWKLIPRMLVTLTKEKGRLRQQGIYSSPPTIRDIEGSSIGQDCGSVQEFFKEYLK